MKDPRTIEEQAAQLARWLDEHPGSAPPDGVDPDVLEAIYALRPDLAPAPSFSVDDILAGITSGPFAQPSAAAADATGELVELPAHEPPPPIPEDDETESTATIPSPTVVDLATERRKRSPWMWSAVGAVAAAAMALIVAIPHLDRGISDEALYAPLQQPSAAPSSSTIAEVADAEADYAPAAVAEPEPEEAEQALERQLQAPDLPVADLSAARDSRSLDAAGASEATLAGDGSTSRSTGALGEIQRDADPRKEERVQSGPSAPKAGAAEPPPASWYSPSADAPTTTSGIATPSAAPAGGPPPAEPSPVEHAPVVSGAYPAQPSATDALALDDDLDQGAAGFADRWDEAAEPEAPVDYDAEVLLTSEQSRRAERKRKDDNERGVELEAEEEDASRAELPRGEVESASAARYGAARVRGQGGGRSSRADKPRADNLEGLDDAPAAATGAATLGLDELRASANPLDYRSEWYQSDPVLDPATKAQLASAYGQAQAAVVAGAPTTASAALEPLLTNAHPRVVQDAAFRIATLQLQQGQRSSALASVDRGLAASNSPTVFRSRLLALRGSILEEQGDTAGALDAYQQAVNANASRY